MKIKNSDVEDLATFLLEFKLKGKENRMRNKFFKHLQSHLKEMQEEHKELLNDYCEKDSDGNFKTHTRDGKSFYDIQEVESFQKEFESLLAEYCYIPSDEGNHEMIQTVKKIILECETEFSGKEALRYETFCELFESEYTTTVS
jgi:hypothetical protein